ncbi:hypothetical protein ACIGW8_36465 [Streptomyces sioyaensis]|uniref:hypothetical protein n=1 Tax=Streptomyces sioyaensis TaxID=67364 RepID=UPI0037D02E07
MTGKRESGPARIAVLATPFGFGPASKAYTVGQVLAGYYGMDVHYYGSGSAGDFFDAQQGTTARRISTAALDRDPGMLDSYDAIVNVLAPELIRSPELAQATYYVDSLGFTWQQADIASDSPLRQVRIYFAQNVFGSVENLTALGVPGVTAVSGIVSAPALPTGPSADGPIRGLVHLGGLRNPAGSASAHAYLPLADSLLEAFQDGSYELSVAMNQSGTSFRRHGGGAARQLSGQDFQQALADSDMVLSSPGLTTLIETSQAGKPYVPLPPQNWSQVVICGHMSGLSGQDIWPFLADRYRTIDAWEPEAAKATAVGEINRRLATDSVFIREFGRLARRAAQGGEAPTVGAPFHGAKELAAVVAADLSGIRGDSDDRITRAGAR